MTILGMILMIIGGILFYGSKIVYNRNEKKNPKKGTSSRTEQEALINNATLATRTIGALMVIAGGILVIFIR